MISTSKILDSAKYWTSSLFDNTTRLEVQSLINNDQDTLEDSFYKDLEFGTGGMRGIMGVGTNRINKYTLGKNTQGLSNYLKSIYPKEPIRVAIAYDCRHNSKSLAKIVANVFSSNGIAVNLFPDLRTTPQLSFAVKHLNCHCGIVLTASHNPPEYNGYKVYWTDGGQLVPPQDKDIIEEINNLNYEDIKFEGNEALITILDSAIDNDFIEASAINGSFNTPQSNKDDIKIAFTSLHGTSITAIPHVLQHAGYNHVYIVEEQATPNGDFPTVTSPNPEEPEALEMALQLATKTNADIVIGTDPDSDRLGIAVRNLDNQLELLNGNQTMMLMTWFLLEQWKKLGKLHANCFVGSTIVSTPMLRVLVEDYNIQYKEGLTGFKWIAKMIKDNPTLDFVGGGEESFGYMVGNFVRDKDAVTSSLLACEIAAQLKADNSSIFKQLLKLYNTYGHYQEALISLVKKGKEGAEEIQHMLTNLRQTPFKELAGESVIKVEDYQASTSKNIITGAITTINTPKSNVLIFYTDKGTKVAARPSGTEPKVKFYISVNTPLETTNNLPKTTQILHTKINSIKTQLGLN